MQWFPEETRSPLHGHGRRALGGASRHQDGRRCGRAGGLAPAGGAGAHGSTGSSSLLFSGNVLCY